MYNRKNDPSDAQVKNDVHRNKKVYKHLKSVENKRRQREKPKKITSISLDFTFDFSVNKKLIFHINKKLIEKSVNFSI